MNTIELTIQRKTDSGYPIIATLTRPGGFLPLRREGILNLDIPALAELQYGPLAYGTAISQALFVEEIRDTFREGLAGGEPLRVLLSIEAPDLRAIDWHRLAAPFDGRWRFLAVQQNTPFSLSIPSPASASFPAIGRRDLRALVLVAGPESLAGDYKLAPFDVAATLASLKKALGNIPCDILSNPSLDTLCAALTSTPYTLLHIVCHGAVNERGETILFFPKDDRKTPTSASELLNRLASLARLPHFVFLSACESALPQNGLGSLAQRLVRELGLPAVLAMTDRVSIATAQAIAAPFYAKLYEHGQPDLALAESLSGLQGKPDLTVPALLSRLGDRPLFSDDLERDLTNKEIDFGLEQLASTLPERAPILKDELDKLTKSLHATLGADANSLSQSSQAERTGTLAALNSLSLEALDLSFNALCLGQTPPAYDSRSPFRGLESFRVEDKDYFFGREALTKKLVQKLSEHNFLAVLGASGSGKSSLVMAGLTPALNVPYAIFRPGAEPLAELEKALQTGPQLLVVDQFEELFTLSAREQRPEFISRLLEQSHRIRVVITLRADFLGEVAPFKLLKDEVQNHQEIIPPMDETELRRAMEGQAGCAGLRFESDLSQQMLDDVSGEPGAMPLLQHALWTLWTRRHGRWLRADEYRAFGGVKQAIASTAEAVFARCADFEKERLRNIFLRLTRLDDSADRRDTRRRVLLRDLVPADSDPAQNTRGFPAATTLLIKQLADARLVVVTGDEVEVAHEALIRHWERLRVWLNDDRDNLRLREGVSDDARRWENAERDESLLNHRGTRLELALAMSKHPHYRLNPAEQAYLDECVDLWKSEKAATTRRRRYAVSGISAALVVIMLILAGWGWTSSENSRQLSYQVSAANAAKATAIGETNLRATEQANAENRRNIALARQLSSQAQLILATENLKQQTAVLLAIQSMRIFPSDDATFILQKSTLSQEITKATNISSDNKVAISADGKILILKRNYDGISAWDSITNKEVVNIKTDGLLYFAVLSPDGKYMILGECGHPCIHFSAKVWSINTGLQIAHVLLNDFLNMVIFSADNKYVFLESQDNIAHILDLTKGKEIAQMSFDSRVAAITVMPDNKPVILTIDNNVVHILDALTGHEIASLTSTGSIGNFQVSPDGKYVVLSDANAVQIWATDLNREINHISLSNNVTISAFSTNSKYIGLGSTNGAISVIETITGKEIAHIKYDGTTSAIAISRDGKHIISGGCDQRSQDSISCIQGSAILWSADTGKEIARMTHDSDVQYVAFSLDEKFFISESHNNLVRVWEIASGQEKVHMTTEGSVYAIAFSPDGKYIVSGSGDNTARVWDAVLGNEIARVVQDDIVFAVAFSPNSKLVVSGSNDHTARVWEAITGKEITRIMHDSEVHSVSFTPDGNLVVTGDLSGTLIVSDVTTGKELARMTSDDWMESFAISPNGKYVITSGVIKSPHVWETITGKKITDFKGRGMSVAFSPDGKHVVFGGSMWDAITGQEIARMNRDEIFNSTAFSPNGNYIVSGRDGKTLRIWDAITGQEITHIIQDGSVNDVAFSPDSKVVALAGCDNIDVHQICIKGTVSLWYTNTGQEIIHMTQNNYINTIKFNPLGKYIALGGRDNIISVWIYLPEDLIFDACSRVTRNLTRSEWQQYIGDSMPYKAVCPNLSIESEPTATPTP